MLSLSVYAVLLPYKPVLYIGQSINGIIHCTAYNFEVVLSCGEEFSGSHHFHDYLEF
jgi:hypothetical protein